MSDGLVRLWCDGSCRFDNGRSPSAVAYIINDAEPVGVPIGDNSALGAEILAVTHGLLSVDDREHKIVQVVTDSQQLWYWAQGVGCPPPKYQELMWHMKTLLAQFRYAAVSLAPKRDEKIYKCHLLANYLANPTGYKGRKRRHDLGGYRIRGM